MSGSTARRRALTRGSAVRVLWLAAILALAGCEQAPGAAGLPEADRSDAPATLLTVHPENGRYFADASGEAVYLTGSHAWMNFQDMQRREEPWLDFDYQEYLELLERYDHNFIRLWRWEAPLGLWAVRPMPYERTGPGIANDGSPKFDLERWNEAYFDRLRERVEAAGERGIYVAIMLFQRTTVWNRNPRQPPDTARDRSVGTWRTHPFNGANNINGTHGDVDGDGQGLETHSLAVPEITRLQEAYVRKVIDTVNDLDNVLYEISNESKRGSREWQYHMIRFIKRYEAGKRKQHPVGMSASGGRTPPPLALADLLASPADWVGPAVGDGFRDDPPSATGEKVLVADTDHLWGAIGGTAEWVWKSFTRGIHTIYMDLLDGRIYDPAWGWGEWDEAQAKEVRTAMGLSRQVARRFDLAKLTPQGSRASSRYCLAHPSGEDAAFVVYVPRGGEVRVDLTRTTALLDVEWLDPSAARFFPADPVTGGVVRSFEAPFEGPAVLLIGSSGTDARRDT